MPTITFRVATWADKSVLRQLVELYQYDMSDFWPQDLNEHGEFGFVGVERYLRNPKLRAYFFLVDGKYAGFGMVDPDVSLPENEYWMGQFFVMKRYRRIGVGKQGARHIFEQHRGRWEIGQVPLNKPARSFWVKTIAEYTNGNFIQMELHDAHWDGYLQCFDNSQGQVAKSDA